MSLKGIKVIEFAGLAPAPFCGKILKDLGASVIRIDKTGSQMNMDRLAYGKQSIAVNLKKKESIEIIKKLASDAHVLIEPFRTGVMERLGLGPNVIQTFNPSIIYARLTGYGQHGELSSKAGHDINYLSYSGVLSCLSREGERPYAPVNIVADFAGGGLMCALAIVSSLFELKNPYSVEKQGKVIDLSMVEGAAYTSSWLWSSRDLPGLWGNKPGANYLDGGLPRYDTYETKDGKFMACGSLEPQFYDDMLKGLGLENTIEEVTRETLRAEFKKKTRDEWVEVFKNLDACVSPVLDLDEATKNEHNQKRGSFIKTSNNTILPTMDWLKKEASNNLELPEIGQHTSMILKNLGYSASEIDHLFTNNIVEQSEKKSKSKL